VPTVTALRDLLSSQDSGMGERSLRAVENQKKSVTLKSPGKIEYCCRYHSNMVGQITVLQ
jgi:plastocyanin